MLEETLLSLCPVLCSSEDVGEKMLALLSYT